MNNILTCGHAHAMAGSSRSSAQDSEPASGSPLVSSSSSISTWNGAGSSNSTSSAGAGSSSNTSYMESPQSQPDLQTLKVESLREFSSFCISVLLWYSCISRSVYVNRNILENTFGTHISKHMHVRTCSLLFISRLSLDHWAHIAHACLSAYLGIFLCPL